MESLNDPAVSGTARSASRPSGRLVIWLLAAAATALVAGAVAEPAWLRSAFGQETGATREFDVSARRYRFTPDRLEVREGDLVTIHLTAEDIPHSFTIDAYRIAKRANPGQTVTFEFRADRAGRFPFYCNLAIDDGCRDMRGELVVQPRSR